MKGRPVTRQFALQHLPAYGFCSSLAHVRYRWPKPDSWMVTPRADSSLSNRFTDGEISVFSGTITAHSKFSLSSRVVISH